jgi:hypothetical protein
MFHILFRYEHGLPPARYAETFYFVFTGWYAFMWRVVLMIWTILVPSCLCRDRSSSPSEVRCKTCKMVVSCSRAILGHLCLTNRRDQLDLGVDLWWGSCILPNGFGVRPAVCWLHAPGRRDSAIWHRKPKAERCNTGT